MSEHEERLSELKKLVLEKLRAIVTVPFTSDLFKNVEIGQVADLIAMDMWVATVELLIPAKKIVKSGGAEYVPVTWWDHLKKSRGWKHKTRMIVTQEIHYHQCPHIITARPREDHIEWLYYAGETEKLKSEMMRENA